MEKELNDKSLKEKIVNIISNNCSRPGFDEYTRSADQILTLLVEKLERMKKDTFGAKVDIFKAPNIGYNECIADIIREVER